MSRASRIEGNVPRLRAKSVHFVGYLPCTSHPAGKLDECSDKLGPIVGNQGESSDRQATIRSQSGLSLTGDGNLYCSFLLKNGLLSCKTSGHGNLSEPSSTKNLGEYSDTKAVHAHFCPNIEPMVIDLNVRRKMSVGRSGVEHSRRKNLR